MTFNTKLFPSNVATKLLTIVYKYKWISKVVVNLPINWIYDNPIHPTHLINVPT